MNSMIRTRLVATALFGATLVGCNAVEDVREPPFTPVPEAGVVLQGRVTGPLGNQRAVTLLNNGDNDRAVAVTASLGTDYTVFTFGVVPVGSPYDITVKANPFGKVCTPSGGSGIVTTAEALNIVINCVNAPETGPNAVPRYNLRVAIPSNFGSRTGAMVKLTTEEGVFVIENPANPLTPGTTRVGTIAPGATSVTFNSVLFNNVVGGTVWGSNSTGTTQQTSTAGGGTSPYTNIVGGTVNGAVFRWTVTATTTEGSTPDRPQVNNCSVSAGTNFTGATGGVNGAPGTPNFSPVAGVPQAMPPVTHIGFGAYTPQNPTVNSCNFTVGGTVSYSTPQGGVPQVMPSGSSLQLELRDVQGNVVGTVTHTAGYGASGTTAGGAGAAYTFSTPTPLTSSVNSVFDVVVTGHPTGHHCVVANGGQATLGSATANITNANVFCRARPTGAANNTALKGTYLFLNGETYNYSNPIVNPAAVNTDVTDPDGTVNRTAVTTTTLNTRTTYNSDFGAAIPGATPQPVGESWGQTVVRDIRTRTVVTRTPVGGAAVTLSDTTVDTLGSSATNNNVTRNFLTFFDDGTFLHGVHGSATSSTSNQIEHGFYLYDTTTSTIRFTFITDTNTSGSSAGSTAGTLTHAINVATAFMNTGMSSMGGVATVNGAVTATMTNVAKGSTNGRPTLSGRFAATGAGIGHGTTTAGSRWATWNMIEPKNSDGLMEGPFVTRDHRRVWVYDDNPKLGFHVGVNGGAANLQDSCFTVDNAVAVTGLYTRRGGISGCLGGTPPLDLPQGRTSQTNPPVGTPATLEALPGFVGRIPAGQIAVDGRPPSPAYYVIAAANQFATVAAANPEVAPFFPADEITPAALGWCLNAAGTGPGEVYGVRTSLNGVPTNKASYFCRTRAN